MSYRDHAEEFGRHLQVRLHSLAVADSQRLPHGTDTQSEAELTNDCQLINESDSSLADAVGKRLGIFENDPVERLDHLDMRLHQAECHELILRNGSIDFTTSSTLSATAEESQPYSLDNGHYSAITFDNCHRRSIDSVDVVNGEDGVDCSLKLVNSGTDSDFRTKSETPEDVKKLTEKNTDEASSRSNDDVFHLIESEYEVINNEIEIPPSRSPWQEVNTSSSFHARGECETDDKLQLVRRCSSLKTYKTPPGTPGGKKIVRFADVLGLDLADVKTFMDEIPVVPKSAYVDLLNAHSLASSLPNPIPDIALCFGGQCLTPLFRLHTAAAAPNINDILTTRVVCLETATTTAVEGAALAVEGFVLVRNLDFHKSVHVRYTMDGWLTYTDLRATYVDGSCDGFSDRFQFLLYVPSIRVGQKLEFAVRFQCKGCQFWDNNSGANYCYQCMAL